LRLLVWDDLPAPPEQEVPKVEKMGRLPGMTQMDDESADETDEELEEEAEDEESEE
jgi:hypothetical protein